MFDFFRITLTPSSKSHFKCGMLTRDSHADLHTWAWRPYTEAEVMFKTILGTFEVSSKWLYKKNHLWPLYRPLQRIKLMSDNLPQRFVCSKKMHKTLSFRSPNFFPAKILFYKKFFDFSRILSQYKIHFEIKFLKFLSVSDNFW